MQTFTNCDSRASLIDYLNHQEFVNVFLINIDNFSNINCTYGFEVGDKILLKILELINISKPRLSKLFHMNSDEFAIVSIDRVDEKTLINIASSIVSFFDHIEIDIDNIDGLRVSISMGVASGSGSHTLNNARVAIKEVREHRRGAFKLYNPDSLFIKKQQQNIYWINKIKNAFENEQLVTYYQPIVNNVTNKIEKYECLARILDGDVVAPPISFLNASALTGTLAIITRSVIGQSFKTFSTTNDEFSINITSTDLYLNYLDEFLSKHAKRYNINPSRVVLEILEDVDSLDTPEILLQLKTLRDSGFRIAIDDFGSRSSNLSRLLEFHPDFVKIDGSFIKNILEENNSLIIVETIVELCKKSGIKIVAEYVHSKEVQEKVKELGIDYSQGYFFGEPKKDLVVG